MKKDKLHKYADSTLEKYENPSFREEIMDKCHDKINEKKRQVSRRWISICCSTLAIILVVVSVFLFLPQEDEEKHYMLENQMAENISIEELKKRITNFNINVEYLSHCKLIVDQKYDDELYFNIVFHDDNMSELTIAIVTNKTYIHNFPHNDYNQHSDIYNMQYIESFVMEEVIYFFSCKGEFELGELRVYVTYRGLSLTEKSNFVEFLQQCITIK